MRDEQIIRCCSARGVSRTFVGFFFFRFEISFDAIRRRHRRPLAQLQFRDTSDGMFLISACLDKNPMLRDGNTGDWVRVFLILSLSLSKKKNDLFETDRNVLRTQRSGLECKIE